MGPTPQPRFRKTGAQWSAVRLSFVGYWGRDPDRLAAEALGSMPNDVPQGVRAENEQYRRLVEAITDYAVYMIDAAGVVISWNPGAERFKGYARDEIIGRHFSRFYTEEDRQAGLPARSLKLAATAGRFEQEGWRVRKDGARFWAQVVIDPVRADDGKVVGFAKITRDLTDRRHAEQELKKVREALFQSQKMEAVGQLTGGVAHDFNNLLTVIIGGLETIKRLRLTDTVRTTRAADMALRAAQSAAGLTARLLAFSRKQPLSPAPTDLNLLVRDMTDLLHRTLGGQIELEGVLSPRLWTVEVDQNQLENAILNLAVNARDAMPEGGKLILETANTQLDESYVAGDSEVIPGQYTVLTVTDTGIGMTHAALGRVFEPFYTTKQLGQGTGLGLSMVYGFVKQSGGHITIYSEMGEGTSVKLYFPRCRGERETAPSAQASCPTSKEGEIILVVEDNDEVRNFSVMCLTDLGYAVLGVGDPPAALAILASDQRLDLLFTDVVLPGTSGRQIAEEASRMRPGLKVLYTSGYAHNAVVHHGRLDTGVDMLSKPFTFDQLANRVRDVIDRE
jgi:PAS domain S-box-containing protein